MNISDFEIEKVENLLLPQGSNFSEEAKEIIRCWDSTEILACPGSGKTTVLLAKLKLLSDRMPLDGGQGICVLSHTNVAVNEIKAKMGDSAEKIIGYPNFVGTFQTFVDRYVTFPFLKQIVKVPIQVVDKKELGNALYNLAYKKYRTLAGFLNNQYKNAYAEIYDNAKDFASELYLNNGDLYIRVNGKAKRLAGKETTSAQNYKEALMELLIKEGMLRYEDCYKYTQKAIEVYGESMKMLLTHRFKYVFVDEYQDCSDIQRETLNQLFDGTTTIVQKIGDVDQAIYSNDGDSSSDWCVSQSFLSLSNSNRYGQEIADVLIKLRTNCESIRAIGGRRNIKPVLLVYDENTREKVVDGFIQEICENNLNMENAVFKAVGMYKRVKGLKIGDYWKSFSSESNKTELSSYSDFVSRVCIDLKEGNLYKAEKDIRRLLCRIYHYNGDKVDPQYNASKFNLNTIKIYLYNEHKEEYSRSIIQLVELADYEFESVDAHIRSLIQILLGDNIIDNLPNGFIDKGQKQYRDKQISNKYQDNKNGICIQFDTVYGVKGETHDATLYLETEKSRGTDLKRIMPLLEGKKITANSDIYEKSRKCVYVGFSRPRHLLCVAMQLATYKGHENAFVNWKVINLTKT